MKRVRRILIAVLALLAIKVALDLRPPRTPVAPVGAVLTKVTVINPGRDRRSEQTIVVRGDTIEQISGQPPPGRMHPFTRQLQHRYVLPGLIDLSVYQPLAFPGLRRAFGVYFLYAGVTTVRDIGNFAGDIRATESDIRNGAFAWPRLIACGRVLEGDPPRCARSRVVRDADEAQEAVREVAATGARCVRVQWTLRPDVLAAVRTAAAALGLPVVGDAPLASGVEGPTPNDVQLLSAAPQPAPPQRRSDFLLGWSALDETALERIVQASVPQRTAYTAALWPWFQLARTLTPAGPVDAHLSFLPRAYRDVIWHAQVRTSLGHLVQPAQAGDRSAKQTCDSAVFTMQDAVRRLHAAGVALNGGSATPSPLVAPGHGLKFELGALATAGLSLEDAWVALTRDAGRSIGIPGLGVIEPGAPADLLIFRDDPTQSYAALETLEAIVSGGRLYPRVHLLRAMIDQVRYFEHPIYDTVSGLIARVWVWWVGNETLDCLNP